MTIQELQLPVLDAFNRFKSEYSHCIKGGNEGRYPSIIAEVEEHLSSHPGKMLRPLLLLLSAKACEHLSDMHIKLAVAMELLHNATLMHDDVVDESDKRRGTDSVRHLWGNQAAVLCGDYFLSRVMSILQETGNKQASIIVAKTVATMSLGELKQLKYVGRKDISTDQYLDVIGSKTASLLSVCCELGSLPESGAHAPFCNAMRDFGYTTMALSSKYATTWPTCRKPMTSKCRIPSSPKTWWLTMHVLPPRHCCKSPTAKPNNPFYASCKKSNAINQHRTIQNNNNK